MHGEVSKTRWTRILQRLSSFMPLLLAIAPGAMITPKNWAAQ
jgi:hypothetical protein